MEPAGHSCWRKNRPRQISGAACNLFYPIRLYCTVVRIYPREQTMLLVQMFCWIPMLEFAGMYMPCQAISMPKKKSYQIVDCVDAASSGIIPVVKPDCKRNRVVSETRGSSLKSVSFIHYRVRSRCAWMSRLSLLWDTERHPLHSQLTCTWDSPLSASFL